MEAIVKPGPDSPDLQTRPSPLLKLFGPNPVINGAEVDLRKIRDLIYSHAWSRERRDTEKLDFVVSQWGVNRNVPERFIPDTPYGTNAFLHPEKLRCNLHLVNKEISADFRRYIYSVNDLEIDVDLKPDNTKQSEMELQKIVAFLQNSNFHKYTQTARVRIHFPSKYLRDDLPQFNQRALENIVWALNAFEKLQYLVLRIVSVQEQALDYELRLAAVPFYRLHMTRWSIRILNLTTQEFEIIGPQQLRALDQAWELKQEIGLSSTTEKHDRSMARYAYVKDRPFSATNSAMLSNKRNGSQKRKERKQKAAGHVSGKDNHFGHGSEIRSRPTQASPRPDAPQENTQPRPVSSDTESASSATLLQEDNSDSGRGIMHTLTETPAMKRGRLATNPTPPASASRTHAPQLIDSNSPSSETSTGEVILTPSESTTDGDASSDPPHQSTKVDDGQSGPKTSPCPNQSAHPEACDADPEGCGPVKPADVDDAPNTCRAELDGTRRSKKPKRKSKKSRESKIIDHHDPGQIVDKDTAGSYENEDKKYRSIEGWNSTIEDLPGNTEVALVCDQSEGGPNIFTFPLSSLCDHKDGQIRFTPLSDEGQRLQMPRQSQQVVDFHRRQTQRRNEETHLEEVQKKKVRGKRASKRAKELHLRRENVATNSPLSRLIESRHANQLKTVSKRVVESEPHTTTAKSRVSRDIETCFQQRLGYIDLSHMWKDVSNPEDHRFQLGFDGAPERKTEEVMEDEMDGLRDESTDDGFEEMPSSSDAVTEEKQPVEDDHHKYTKSMFKCVGQEGSKEKLINSPGFLVPQQKRLEYGETSGGQHFLTEEKAQERRNQWTAAAAANDDEYYAQRNKNHASFEGQMEDSGARHADYDQRIHDKWTKTDEAGNCLERRVEEIVYDGQARQT